MEVEAHPIRPGRLRRTLTCIAFVGLWMGLGFALHLQAEVYLLIGVPLTLAFQLLVARAPLASLWVRGASRLRLDRSGVLVAMGLGGAPVASIVYAARAGRAATVAWSLAA